MAARAQKMVNELKRCNVSELRSLPNIEYYLEIGWRQLDQVKSRLLDGETIPNEAKVFSVFEPRTRSIRKGKAGIAGGAGRAGVPNRGSASVYSAS